MQIGLRAGLVFFIAPFIFPVAHGVSRHELRHVPAQRIAKDAGSTEMDTAEDASVGDL